MFASLKLFGTKSQGVAMKVAIFGCGALGSNLVYILAGAHPDWEYHLFDFDKIESRNIPNQWFRPSQIGLYKSEALQINLYDQYGIIAKSHKTKIDKDSITKVFEKNKIDLAIDCLDNFKSRKLLTGLTVPTLHLTYSAQKTFEVIWDEQFKPQKAQDEFDICTWRGAKTFICLVAALGGLAVNHWMLYNIKINFLGNERAIKSWII